MQQNPTQVTTSQATQPDQLVLDVRQFAPNPVKLASDKNLNKLSFAFVGGVAGAAISYYGGRRGLGTSNRLLTSVCGAALGAIGGGLIGAHIKTSEEARSEVLMNAAHSGSFAQNVKKEMESRENNAFLLGALAGIPLWL